MKKLFVFLSTLTIAFTSILFQQCYTDGFDNKKPTAVVLTEKEYEAILKAEVDGIIAQSGKTSEHFFSRQGFPVWESAKWETVNSKRMLVVPLVTPDGSDKFIVGVASDGKIPAVVTEISATRSSANKIYSLGGKVLFENDRPTTVDIRSRVYDERCSCVADNLLLDGGNAYDLYQACYDTPYDLYAMAGTLSINTSQGMDGNGNPTGIGHAWLEFTDTYGNTTTFGTWGESVAGKEYAINIERDNGYSGYSYGTAISYGQFQNILNYNSNSGNTDWSLINDNCSTYAAGAWNAATGNTIDMGMLDTPADITGWITSQNEWTYSPMNPGSSSGSSSGGGLTSNKCSCNPCKCR